MKVGLSISMHNVGEKTDYAVYRDELRLVDMAEAVGFDSIWAVEHHFTGYSMVPNPIQILTYMAGRTTRMELGTGVVVLPWHDPIRVAEELAMLDNLSGGRLLVGFGRGAAAVEYDGFGVLMSESRERFAEAATVVTRLLSEESVSFAGKYFKLSNVSIRPRPISRPHERIYASTISNESKEMMAKFGFGPLIIPQRDWDTTASDIGSYQAMVEANGYRALAPVGLFNVYVSESRDEAQDGAIRYMGAMQKQIDAHYRFSADELKNVKGYETYSNMAKAFTRLTNPEEFPEAMRQYIEIHVSGTPIECLEKLAKIREKTGLDHFVAQFDYGGMTPDVAERNFRLFANKLLPALHQDPSFIAPPIHERTKQARVSDEERLSERLTGPL